MCRDGEGGWVAVEIKRIATIEAVEQLSRYLESIRVDPARAECRANPRRPVGQAAGGEARGVAWAGLRRGRPRAPAWRARARADTLRLSPKDRATARRCRRAGQALVSARARSRLGAPTRSPPSTRPWAAHPFLGPVRRVGVGHLDEHRLDGRHVERRRDQVIVKLAFVITPSRVWISSMTARPRPCAVPPSI